MFKNRLGVCCITLGQKSDFKTLQLNRTKDLSNKQDKIFDVYRHNLSELCKVLGYLTIKNIRHYRISSNMFPLADHPDFEQYWNLFCSKEVFWIPARMSVQKYLANGGRLSTHPDQFCIISSPKDDVNINGVRNLEYHAKMFDMLNIPSSHFCPINIHVSNGNNPEIAIKQVDRNLPKLSSSVMNRLVFETEDKSFWKYQNLHKYFPNIPITLDYHHRLINNDGELEETAHEVCVGTWKDTVPLFHHSEGKAHSLDRAHADFINNIPHCAVDVDIEIEAKQKDLAVLKLMC